LITVDARTSPPYPSLRHLKITNVFSRSDRGIGATAIPVIILPANAPDAPKTAPQ